MSTNRRKRDRAGFFLRIKNNRECKKNLYVSLYEMRRYYGGPEEGGWHYNNYVLVESHCRRNHSRNLENTKNRLQKQIDDELEQFKEDMGRPWRDQYSSRPDGSDMIVFVEEYPGKHQYLGRPHYE